MTGGADVAKLVSLALSVAIFGFVLWLAKERRLREKYAVLWVLTCLFLVLLTLSRRVLEGMALSIGIYYPPSLLFLLGLLFLVAVCIGHSISLTRLSDTNLKLAQELALLKEELAKNQGSITPPPKK